MKEAFTLIELLVVVLIIGILAAVAVPQYQKAVLKTKVVTLLPLLRAIADAENRYYMANDTYTTNFNDLDISMPGGASTVTDSTITYQTYLCYLRTGEEGTRSQYSAYCNSRVSGAPTMERYFTRDYFICWAAENTPAYSVCQSISGTSEPMGTGTTGNYKGFQVK